MGQAADHPGSVQIYVPMGRSNSIFGAIAVSNIWPILFVFVLVGCGEGMNYTSECKKDLSALNFSKSETITFMRIAYGPGFSLLTKGCDFLVPMDFAEMPTGSFVQVNDLMLDMIATQDGQKAYGVFEAECECDYNHKDGIVRVKTMVDVRLHSKSGELY